MELYTLDSLLRREDVIDTFESVIWTDRYSADGELKLKVPASNEFRQMLRAGTMLSSNVSDAVMTIKYVQDGTDDEGNSVLEISGASLEDMLRDRFVKQTLSDTTTEPKWVITGTPGNVVRKLFQDICVTGTLSLADRIPFIQPGTIYPASNIPEYSEPITVEIPVKSLYDAIKEICDIYDLGFRLTRHGDTSKLYFEVFTGIDRTVQQNILPAIVFSPEMENMHNTREITSFEGVKNIAYVFSPVGYEIVYSPGTDASTSGFDRKVLVIEATDITDEDPEVASARMTQRGIEELLKTRPVFLFDGEVDQNYDKVYGVDYGLGDLVTAQNATGVVEGMKITEQIFIQDREGFRSYPTLSVRSIIDPGTWLGWKTNQVWADMGLTEYWDTMP